MHGLYPFVPDGGDVLFVVATNFVTSARGLAFWPLPEDPAAGVGAGTHLIDDAEAPLAWLGARGRVHFWTHAAGRRARAGARHRSRPPGARALARGRSREPRTRSPPTPTPCAPGSARCAGDRLLLTYLHHASHRVRVFDLDGAALGELALPPLVSVEEIVAEQR